MANNFFISIIVSLLFCISACSEQGKYSISGTWKGGNGKVVYLLNSWAVRRYVILPWLKMKNFTWRNRLTASSVAY